MLSYMRKKICATASISAAQLGAVHSLRMATPLYFCITHHRLLANAATKADVPALELGTIIWAQLNRD
jgi:hypothetical protein